MSINSNRLAWPARATAGIGIILPTAVQDLAIVAHRLWTAYWDRKARRATVLMLEALDDRTLRDIGFSRSEIRPAVFGSDAERPRPYDPYWHKRSL